MENVRDWCISRQLWWGHRIPAFYCDSCGEMTVSKTDITVCPHCGAPVRQEEDVLDTWFSSALWPFSTLGWPDKTPDLARYYPTSVLVTGYDIIFFWVARMIFSGLEHMGEKPFSTVFIHGLVRDAQGRKMSKSLGNGIDPLQVIDKYGADALRFALAWGNSPGNDMRFSDEKIEAARNFANKLWNAARFVLMNVPEGEDCPLGPAEELAAEDKWILTRFEKTVESVTQNLENYELGVALTAVYDFLWDEYCDWYIELCKSRLYEKESAGARTARGVLVYVLRETLKLLHPYMPFITEEIYQALPGSGESIMISAFPQVQAERCFPAEAADTAALIDLIRAIRNRRTEMNVPPSRRAALTVVSKKPEVFRAGAAHFCRLCGASTVTVADGYAGEQAVTVVTDAATAYIPLSEMLDLDKERTRLQGELEKTRGEIARVEGKLQNENFVSRAPEAVVNAERDKLERYRATAASLEEELKKLG